MLVSCLSRMTYDRLICAACGVCYIYGEWCTWKAYIYCGDQFLIKRNHISINMKAHIQLSIRIPMTMKNTNVACVHLYYI